MVGDVALSTTSIDRQDAYAPSRKAPFDGSGRARLAQKLDRAPASSSRRGPERAATPGAYVLGFDPLSQRWITEGHAGEKPPGLHLPRLDGTLRTARLSVPAASEPVVVLEPCSVEDVARMVRYARRNGLRIAMCGQGHDPRWRAQMTGGIVIDSTRLSMIRFLSGDRVRVGAGVVWADLVRAADERGVATLVSAEDLALSIGGALARVGRGADHSAHGDVLELEVVTAGGDVETCSPTHNTRTFDAVLSGFRHRTFIVGATIRLRYLKPTWRTETEAHGKDRRT